MSELNFADVLRIHYVRACIFRSDKNIIVPAGASASVLKVRLNVRILMAYHASPWMLVKTPEDETPFLRPGCPTTNALVDCMNILPSSEQVLLGTHSARRFCLSHSAKDGLLFNRFMNG